MAVFTTLTRSNAAILADVSSTGVRLRGQDLPELGEELEIRMDTIRAFGRVMWSQEGECGIAFDSPLSLGDVWFLRQLATTMAGLPPQLKAAFDDWSTGMAR